MSERACNGMNNLDGWHAVPCLAADIIRGLDLQVGSSLTDPEGQYSGGVVFTEWWGPDYPVLRDYRFTDSCAHYVPSSKDAWFEEADEDEDDAA